MRAEAQRYQGVTCHSMHAFLVRRLWAPLGRAPHPNACVFRVVGWSYLKSQEACGGSWRGLWVGGYSLGRETVSVKPC